MEVSIDESLATGCNGIYTFRADGSIYHSIGSLLPNENSRPRREDIPSCKLIIKEQQPNQRQYNLPTASQIAAVIVDNECSYNLSSRDIIIQGIGGHLMNIQDIVGYYDPLQYPLLLPYGTYGWDTNSRNNDGSRVTCLNYYAYMLQIRENSSSLLLRGGRLLQQYVVDNYVKIETHRLRWIHTNQSNIRSDLYQGLQDCLNGGENNAGNVGHGIVLPSTFVGSPRDMYQRYQDAMTLVQTYGKPDLMITMTCNPNWHEIKEQLLLGKSPQDRPDLITRIFKIKFDEFKKDVVDRGVLGRVRSYSYVIEYQKRGLPHVHMLVIFDNIDKRREGMRVVSNNNDQVIIDNGWVVPYNPWLLLKYDCHINVEVCGGIKCVKYIYKYIHKGPDRVALELRNRQNCDEIQQYVDGRWIFPPEALWRIYSFEFSRMYPSVIRLQIHLPNEQLIRFNPEQSLGYILANDDNSKTMLTEFFKMNSNPTMVEKYLYREFPQHYAWIQSGKKWTRRRSQNKFVGRIYVVSPSEEVLPPYTFEPC
ncbi:uncharacterized protein [Henckelia pumila]|uniref:uncharacterized protein n=1 Tax=Henckelia pumila TaxID=405737 RepID=UPI003C6E6DD2